LIEYLPSSFPRSSFFQVRNKAVNPFAAPSILTVDPSSSLAANLVMHGRVLDVEFAVTREEAAKLKDESDRRKEKVDKRNTYLMREGGESRLSFSVLEVSSRLPLVRRQN